MLGVVQMHSQREAPSWEAHNLNLQDRQSVGGETGMKKWSDFHKAT